MVFLLQKITLDFDDYYINFNVEDYFMYGGLNTALGLGQMQLFLILNGGHLDGFADAAKEGLEKCFAYFRTHIDQANKYSEHNLSLDQWVKLNKRL